jgi:hypothetical protein
MKDKLQDIALTTLVIWSTALEIVMPSAEKRTVIREATAQVKTAKAQHRQLTSILADERATLQERQTLERVALACRHKTETQELLDRQAGVKAEADAALRTVRGEALSSILMSNRSNPVAISHETQEASPAPLIPVTVA